MKFWYFPLSYMFVTRYKTKLDMLSWFVQRIFPVFLVIGFELGLTADNVFKYLLIYVLADMIFISLYEIGYIYNDVFTIKKESSPTIRLNQAQLKEIEFSFRKIIFIKIVISSLLLLVLVSFSDFTAIKIYSNQYGLILIFMALAFFGHNLFRSKLNILTFSILVFCKFSYALLLFIPVDEILAPLLVVLIMFPIPRIVEHASKPKYNIYMLSSLVGKHDAFRAIYFGMMILVYLAIQALSSYNYLLLFYVLIYFFAYRMTSLLLIFLKIHRR